MNLQINQELAQAILNYLVTKPYAEVYGLVQGIQKLQPVEVPNDSSE